VVAAISPGGAASGSSSGTSSPAPASKKHDPCGATKSKWQHMECMEYHESAPGDEYFGRMKMSYLGIDNTFKDGAISAGAYSTDPNLISKLDFAAQALDNWAAKYPDDPQLPRSYFFGVEVFRKIYTQPEQERTWHYIRLLVTKYKNTYFGKIMTADIAKGFTEHWFGAAQYCPTPLPKGVMPAATPAATPTPSPAPGQPAIDIITPPCIARATPSPLPSPSPSPSRT
jgi:hypothetical protein